MKRLLYAQFVYTLEFLKSAMMALIIIAMARLMYGVIKITMVMIFVRMTAMTMILLFIQVQLKFVEMG